jgi:fatty-acyl-CoA synthase
MNSIRGTNDLGSIPETGLFSWLATASRDDPNREALISREDHHVTAVTLRELVSKSLSFATGLQSIGVTDGSTVAIWLPNQIEWMVTQFACSAIGAAVLGLNTRYKSFELTHLLGVVPLQAVILPSDFMGIDFVGSLKNALERRLNADSSFQIPSLIFVGDVPERATVIGANAVRYEDLTALHELKDWRDHASAISNLFATSGSTSTPKVAGHDQASTLHHAFATANALGVRQSDRILAALPLCGVFGFNSVMAVLSGGGAALLVQSFDTNEATRHLCESAITHVVGGDEMLWAMFTAIPDHVQLPTLRRGGVANFAGRAKAVVELAQDRWGVSISGVYGSSELFALTAIWPEAADLSLRCLQGGLPVEQGIEVRVIDSDTLQPVSPGEVGELQFKGYNVIDGYVNNPEATRDAFTSDGWFCSGDLGHLASGGFVFQCRVREVLRLKGFLVEPGEIEDFFTLEATIDEVHVVGVDTETGTKVVAFVRPQSGCSVDEVMLIERAKHDLAAFKVPERVIEVSEFPTTFGTNGAKVRVDVLRESARAILNLI